jgi:hypothetical protein
VTGTEDIPTTFTAAQLLGNDSDVEGDALTIASVSAASGGTATLNPDGTVSFAPNPNFNGTATFNYTASDGAASSAVTPVRILVAPVNDAPVALPDIVAAVEDTPITYTAAQLLGNDTDVDADTLRIASVLSGSGGTATLNANGTVSFTPNANFNGPADFTYFATDGALTSPAASVTVNVAAVNDAPVATADAASTIQNQALVFPPSILLANDTDVDAGDTLGIASVQNATSGVVALDAFGNVVFTPNAGYAGQASFSYTVSDTAGALATASVNVTVIAPSSGPLLVVPPSVFSLGAGATPTVTVPSGAARISDRALERTVELAPGALDLFNPPRGAVVEHLGNVNVAFGGLSNQGVSMRAGSAVAFDWTFSNAEDLAAEINGGFNDLLLVIVTDPAGLKQVFQLSSSEQTGPAPEAGTISATGTFPFTAILSGEYTFSWLVTNSRDDQKPSSMSIASPRFIVNGNSFGQPVPLDIAVQSIDAAAAPSLAIRISGVPAGAALSAGTDLGAGDWALTPAQLAGLQFLPGANFAGTVNLAVSASNVDVLTGILQTVSKSASVTVESASTTAVGTDNPETLTGTSANDHLQGFAGDDILSGVGGNDILYGDAGNDAISGGLGNDRIFGGANDDALVGDAGNDRITGGTGNDRLTGGIGSDTFAWTLSDRGLPGNPATDIIVDFSFAVPATDGDVLDLRDLLIGEAKAGLAAGNLDQFLDFDTTSTPGTTVIRISTAGGFAGGTYSAASEDQRIVLEGVDLRAGAVFGLGAGASDADIVQQLLQRGKLIADGP